KANAKRKEGYWDAGSPPSPAPVPAQPASSAQGAKANSLYASGKVAVARRERLFNALAAGGIGGLDPTASVNPADTGALKLDLTRTGKSIAVNLSVAEATQHVPLVVVLARAFGLTLTDDKATVLNADAELAPAEAQLPEPIREILYAEGVRTRPLDWTAIGQSVDLQLQI